MASITTLCKVYWHRIVLDEAHKIRNPKTAMAKGVTALKKGLYYCYNTIMVYEMYSSQVGSNRYPSAK